MIYVANFPIEDEGMSMVDLKQEAVEETRALAHRAGFNPAGEFTFELVDTPLAMVLVCAVVVVPLRFDITPQLRRAVANAD